MNEVQSTGWSYGKEYEDVLARIPAGALPRTDLTWSPQGSVEVQANGNVEKGLKEKGLKLEMTRRNANLPTEPTDDVNNGQWISRERD
jgi:hypothetical protein